jgi:hypothetical protein
MHPCEVERCLQQAAELSAVHALLRHPEHGDMWSVVLDGSAVLYAESEPARGRLSLWAELGTLADAQQRDAVHGLMARYAASVERSRIVLGDAGMYELHSHWPLRPGRPADLAALFDHIAPVVHSWREILARPPVERPPPATLDGCLADLAVRYCV